MLDRQLIRKEPDRVRTAIARKGLKAPVDEFLATDEQWRAATHRLNELQSEINSVSKSIGQLRAEGKMEEFEAARAKTGDLKNEIKGLEEEEKALEARLAQIELKFPNMPHESVPDGLTAEENVVVRSWGTPRTDVTESHWDIIERLKLVDLERGAKISGSGFVVYTGRGARLWRALLNFMLDLHTGHGYQEVYPPSLVNAASLIGTGNLPKFEEDLYKVSEDEYLIPTAEVPVTNLYRDEILEADQVPTRLCAFTPCFRKEAGAAGRDTRGIQRMHQFEKVEMVRFELPENSYAALEELTKDAERVLQTLEIPYRVLELCAGDMGDKGCKCYDLEAHAPAEGRWLEVSSCTNFEAYQARRANIRFRRSQGEKPEFIHILNGSGLAFPRTMIAILENGLQADGSVLIPEALRPYFGSDRIEA